MKRKHGKLFIFTMALLVLFSIAFAITKKSSDNSIASAPEQVSNCMPESEPACVMKTLFGLETKSLNVSSISTAALPEEANEAIQKGLLWMSKAQLQDGGWGAGSHSYQNVKDPHKVKADPATTALVSLSILRTGNSLTGGTYAEHLKRSTLFLLEQVENWEDSEPYLTSLKGTQPQSKLGQNIDAILTVQFLTSLLEHHGDHEWAARITNALNKCVGRIEKQQDTNGSWKGGGWAPVLQSALAGNALESAKDAGIEVDSMVLVRSKNYQMGNFDTATKSTVTSNAAGIMLYSLSGTTRASAKESEKAVKLIQKAKEDGKIQPTADINEENLKLAGAAPDQAKELYAAYNINKSSSKIAVRDDVMSGFGNNGGEEFLSYLMTGESIYLQGGNEWKHWFDMMLKKIITIQLQDGSWEGHHCITSPVFCTATCLLILSIENERA